MVGLLFAAVALLVHPGDARRQALALELREQGLVTDAVVLAISGRTGPEWTEVRFDVGGDSITTDLLDDAGAPVGDRVEISYLASDPSQAMSVDSLDYYADEGVQQGNMVMILGLAPSILVGIAWVVRGCPPWWELVRWR